MCSPARRGRTRIITTSTLPSVPALLLQERLRHPSSHARTQNTVVWLSFVASIDRRRETRSIASSPTSNTSSTGLRPPRRAGRLPRPARLDLLHRFHRREDDARRPRRRKATIQPPKSTTTATAVRSSRPGKRSRLPRSSPRASKRQRRRRCASRVTRSPSRNRSGCLETAPTRSLARPPAGRRGRASRSVQRTKHRRSERHRVQGRSPHRRTQRGRSAEAIDARRDVQPPEWSRTNQRRRQDCGLGTFAPEAASTHEHKCSSRCAFVSLLRSPTTNAETIQEAPSSRYENYSDDPLVVVGFCLSDGLVEAVVLTVSTRELRTDRRKAVAVGGGRRRRRNVASLRWLARSVVSGGIGRQVADSRGRPDAPRGRPRSSSNHIDELLVRPPPEATPASAGRRHILVVKVPPDVL